VALLATQSLFPYIRGLQAYDDLEHFETPFVVKLHRFNTLAATQDVFTFVHPNRDAIIDNTRCAPQCARQGSWLSPLGRVLRCGRLPLRGSNGTCGTYPPWDASLHRVP